MSAWLVCVAMWRGWSHTAAGCVQLARRCCCSRKLHVEVLCTRCMKWEPTASVQGSERNNSWQAVSDLVPTKSSSEHCNGPGSLEKSFLCYPCHLGQHSVSSPPPPPRHFLNDHVWSSKFNSTIFFLQLRFHEVRTKNKPGQQSGKFWQVSSLYVDQSWDVPIGRRGMASARKYIRLVVKTPVLLRDPLTWLAREPIAERSAPTDQRLTHFLPSRAQIQVPTSPRALSEREQHQNATTNTSPVLRICTKRPEVSFIWKLFERIRSIITTKVCRGETEYLQGKDTFLPTEMFFNWQILNPVHFGNMSDCDPKYVLWCRSVRFDRLIWGQKCDWTGQTGRADKFWFGDKRGWSGVCCLWRQRVHHFCKLLGPCSVKSNYLNSFLELTKSPNIILYDSGLNDVSSWTLKSSKYPRKRKSPARIGHARVFQSRCSVGQADTCSFRQTTCTHFGQNGTTCHTKTRGFQELSDRMEVKHPHTNSNREEAYDSCSLEHNWYKWFATVQQKPAETNQLFLLRWTKNGGKSLKFIVG